MSCLMVGTPTDTEPWIVDRGESPLLATAIHDGHRLRPEVERLLAIDADERLREEDPHTARWTTVASNRFVPSRSRFEVDLNRPRDAAVYLTPGDAWGLRLWRRPPPSDLVRRSLDLYDRAYGRLRSILDGMVARHGRVVVLDVHSYNHRRGGPDAPPADPAGNPEVNVGTGSMDRRRWGPLVDTFITDLRGEGLDVRENVRFHGGHLAAWVHKIYPTSACALALEFKKTYMDEWTGEPDEARIAGLGEALAATVPGLRDALAGSGRDR